MRSNAGMVNRHGGGDLLESASLRPRPRPPATVSTLAWLDLMMAIRPKYAAANRNSRIVRILI